MCSSSKLGCARIQLSAAACRSSFRRYPAPFGSLGIQSLLASRATINSGSPTSIFVRTSASNQGRSAQASRSAWYGVGGSSNIGDLSGIGAIYSIDINSVHDLTYFAELACLAIRRNKMGSGTRQSIVFNYHGSAEA